MPRHTIRLRLAALTVLPAPWPAAMPPSRTPPRPSALARMGFSSRRAKGNRRRKSLSPRTATVTGRRHARRPTTTVMVAAFAISIGLCAQPAYAAKTELPQREMTSSSLHVSRVARVQLGEVVSRTSAETAAFESRLASALQKMLDTVLGPGRAVVTAAVELDLDQVETLSTIYSRDPSAGALSEELSRRSYTGDNAGTRYESSSVVRSHALNSVRETRRNAPGRVKKLSVAVLVDATAAENIDVAQLQALVSVAAGIDPRRGDAVAVAVMPLHTAAAADTAVDPDARPEAGRQAVVLIAALALILLLLVLAARRYTRREKQRSAERIHLQQMRALLVEQQTIAATAFIAPATPARARPGNAKRQHMIGRPVGDNRERSAAVLRTWLDQGASR